MAELSVLSNCARAVSVEQVKQVREIVRDFYHGSASLPLVSPQPRAVESGWVEPTLLASWKPPGDKYIDMLLTDADRKERIARSFPLMKPNDKSDECELPDVCPCKGD